MRVPVCEEGPVTLTAMSKNFTVKLQQESVKFHNPLFQQ